MYLKRSGSKRTVSTFRPAPRSWRTAPSMTWPPGSRPKQGYWWVSSQLVHEKAGHFAERVASRGVDIRADLDIRSFVERAVLALETAAYETADLTVAPQRFFQQIDRANRLIALALSLSQSSRQFFKDLGQVDASYSELLDSEQGVLRTARDLDRREELRPVATRAIETLTRLRRLVAALAGKYVDYRLNQSIESIRFMLDRDGEQFYEAVSSPSHPTRRRPPHVRLYPARTRWAARVPGRPHR